MSSSGNENGLCEAVESCRGARRVGSLRYRSSNSCIALNVAAGKIAAMSDYTIVNMKEVEDQAPKFGLSPDLEARFARVPLDAELIGFTLPAPRAELPIPWGHTHKTQEEVFLLVSGQRRGSSSATRSRAQAVGRGPGAQGHDARLRGRPEGAEFIVVGAPAGPGDAEMDQGWWSD